MKVGRKSKVNFLEYIKKPDQKSGFSIIILLQ